jgi:hypothetical protein
MRRKNSPLFRQRRMNFYRNFFLHISCFVFSDLFATQHVCRATPRRVRAAMLLIHQYSCRKMHPSHACALFPQEILYQKNAHIESFLHFIEDWCRANCLPPIKRFEQHGKLCGTDRYGAFAHLRPNKSTAFESLCHKA